MIAALLEERSTFLVATLSDVLSAAAKLASAIAHLMMSSSTNHAQKSNQAMERTTTRRAFTLLVTNASPLRAALALGGRRSSCSR
jgi:hypothetical protein